MKVSAVQSEEFLTEKHIDLNAMLESFCDFRSGAMVVFCGMVRNTNLGQKVVSLEYDAFKPLAEKIMIQIVNETIDKWSLHGALCKHRIGPVEVAQNAVVVITSAAHREDAYDANRHMIDRIKYEVPIWKKEYYADTTSRWTSNDER